MSTSRRFNRLCFPNLSAIPTCPYHSMEGLPRIDALSVNDEARNFALETVGSFWTAKQRVIISWDVIILAVLIAFVMCPHGGLHSNM